MKVQKLKTLVVDDNLAFLDSMKKTLESKNCEVVCLTDAHKALHHLIYEHYHVVFLDCVLQNKNGTWLGSRIRDILGDSVQIIMMSGVVSSKSLSSYIDLGFDFLSKPISDSEIEISIRKIKEKYAFYGKYNNILIKLFQKDISPVEILRFFSSLKTARHYEFFLYVGAALSSRESLKLTYTLNNKTQEIFLNEGHFIDYKSGNPKLYIEKLLSNNLIEPETAFKLKNKTEDECTEYLISSLSVSPNQILNVKYNWLIETFKSIHPGMEVPLNFQMVPKKKLSSSILSQNEYADIIFFLLKQKFNNQIFSLFDKNVMERYFIFDAKLDKNYYRPELTSIIKELKSEIKLEALYKTDTKDKNTFCFYLFYILLKGGVFISSRADQSSYEYLYERYQKLEKFIKQTAKKDFFQIVSDVYGKSLNDQKKKEIYINFLKVNHPDKMSSYNLSKKIIDQINKTLMVFKNVYEEETNTEVKSRLQKKEKEDILKSKILLSEKRKKVERFLIQGNYESAHSILRTVPKNKVDTDLEWQMLFVWFDLKSKKILLDITKKTFLSWQAFIQKNKKKLEEHKLYYYIVGLKYIKREEYEKALESFKISKKLDYSFRPNYEEIQNCTLLLLKQKQNSSSLISKLMQFKTKTNAKKKIS